MELITDDLAFVVGRIPKDIRKLLMDAPILLAGGFIRATISGEKPSDVDLFGGTKDLLELHALKLATERKGRNRETDNAFTVLAPPRMPVQFIHRWLYEHSSEGVAKLLAEFDFTIAQAVIWHDGDAWRSMVSDRFYPDLAAKRLVYTSPRRAEAAGGSLLRVRKFLMRGYTIQAPSLGAVIARLTMAVRWDQVDERDEVMVAKVITGLLREVDPLAIIDGFNLANEHEIEVTP